MPSLGSDPYKIPLSSGCLPLVFCRIALPLNTPNKHVLLYFDSLPFKYCIFLLWGKLDFSVDYEVFRQAKMELGGMSADMKIWKGH